MLTLRVMQDTAFQQAVQAGQVQTAAKAAVNLLAVSLAHGACPCRFINCIIHVTYSVMHVLSTTSLTLHHKDTYQPTTQSAKGLMHNNANAQHIR